MKQYQNRVTGVILTPASDFAAEQLEKSTDYAVYTPPEKPMSKMSKDELLLRAEKLGITIPDGAKKEEILALLPND